jgi:hypothetical protein
MIAFTFLDHWPVLISALADQEINPLEDKVSSSLDGHSLVRGDVVRLMPTKILPSGMVLQGQIVPVHKLRELPESISKGDSARVDARHPGE